MPVSQAVPLPCAYFYKYALCCCQFGFLGGEQSRVSQDVYIPGLDGCQVGSSFYWFNDGFTMNHHYLRSQLSGSSGSLSNGLGWQVGEFDSGDGKDVPVVSGCEAVFAKLGDYSF